MPARPKDTVTLDLNTPLVSPDVIFFSDPSEKKQDGSSSSPSTSNQGSSHGS